VKWTSCANEQQQYRLRDINQLTKDGYRNVADLPTIIPATPPDHRLQQYSFRLVYGLGWFSTAIRIQTNAFSGLEEIVTTQSI
jgi:hypothetical protein